MTQRKPSKLTKLAVAKYLRKLRAFVNTSTRLEWQLRILRERIVALHPEGRHWDPKVVELCVHIGAVVSRNYVLIAQLRDHEQAIEKVCEGFVDVEPPVASRFTCKKGLRLQHRREKRRGPITLMSRRKMSDGSRAWTATTNVGRVVVRSEKTLLRDYDVVKGS